MAVQNLEDVIYQLKQSNEHLQEVMVQLSLFRRDTDRALSAIFSTILVLLGVIAWRVW